MRLRSFQLPCFHGKLSTQFFVFFALWFPYDSHKHKYSSIHTGLRCRGYVKKSAQRRRKRELWVRFDIDMHADGRDGASDEKERKVIKVEERLIKDERRCVVEAIESSRESRAHRRPHFIQEMMHERVSEDLSTFLPRREHSNWNERRLACIWHNVSLCEEV